MATPKKRSSRAARGERRSHDALVVPRLSKCAKTGMPKLSHRVCEEICYYGKSKRVFEVDERL
jgi:large subunit ribosomal protein L32